MRVTVVIDTIAKEPLDVTRESAPITETDSLMADQRFVASRIA